MHTNDRLRQLVNIVGIPLGIALNLIPFGGQNVGEVADSGPSTAVEAAVYAFAIWAVIFSWQLVYAVWQVLPAQRENPVLRRIGWFTAANGLANGAWAIAVQNRQTALAAAILVVVMLGSLVAIETRFPAPYPEPGGRELWLARVPYSINLAWISVATILSVAGVLRRDLGWEGTPFAPEVWAALMIAVAAALGVVMLLARNNLAYAAVIVWALVAVAVKQAAVPLVPLVAVIGAASVAVDIVGTVLLRRGRRVGAV